MIFEPVSVREPVLMFERFAKNSENCFGCHKNQIHAYYLCCEMRGENEAAMKSGNQGVFMEK